MPWSNTWHRSETATRSCGPMRPVSSACWPSGPRRPARSPRTRWWTFAGRWVSGQSGSAANVCSVRLADLELDLDVFAGPFELLLTLILREEVDLLEA